MYPLDVLPVYVNLEVSTASCELKASEHCVPAATHLGGTQRLQSLLPIFIFFGGGGGINIYSLLKF